MKTTIHNRRNGVCFSRCCNSKFSLLAVGALFSCLPAGAQITTWEADLPDPDAPWPSAGKQGKVPPQSDARSVPAAKPTTTSTTVTSPGPAAATPDDAPVLDKVITTRHALSLSADYMLGQGTITLPFGNGLGVSPRIDDADRDSTYYGATYAYSLGQAWYLDLAFTRGDSSGDFSFNLGGVPLPSSFSIEDNWYQVYVRYTFPQLRGKRFQAYIRGGVSYVQADLTVIGRDQNLLYNQQTQTDELYGNLGLGMNYPVYRKGRFQIRFNSDVEVFYGQRSTELNESIQFQINNPPPATLGSDSFDSAVYGGYARATVRLQYELTESGFLKAFLEGGAQVKYTQIDYPQGWFDELLWGPYIKAGLLYSF